MDLAADSLLSHWPEANSAWEIVDVGIPYRRLATRVPLIGGLRLARNVDRIRNRFRTLPRRLRTLTAQYDAFHIVDHSYAHAVHELPAERTGVYCHDLDTFRCLLRPDEEPRPWWFRRMSQRILTGLQSAAIVFHSTHAMRHAIIDAGIAPNRLRHVPLGVAPEFLNTDLDAAPSAAVAGFCGDHPYVLHIGSCIPRKRIDVLLDVFAALRQAAPDLRLVKVGAPWTTSQRRRIAEGKLDPAITHLGMLARPELADVYRNAAAVLVPSDAEGFGLPVIEALACGTPVVASDLPTLREAGGDLASYAPVADIRAWVMRIQDVLRQGTTTEDRRLRRLWAAQFSWANHARAVAAAYDELVAAPKQ